MEVNYEDKRFEQVEADKNAAMQEIEQTYGNMIDQSDGFYQQQIEASKQWADTQSQLQQEQTDFTIEQIEQQKAQAQKDYQKEQSGAYVDWKKQSQQHGVNAEQMAAAGMTNTGFSESSQVSMYNTYQNRVASAREVFSQAVMNYDNAMKDARLQNNAVLAEIAYQSLQQQLELSLQGFQYKNQLLLDRANKKIEMENTYYSRYQDVLDQINYENATAEQIRQYNQNYELEIKRQEEAIRQFNEEIARLKANDEISNKALIERLEMDKAAVEEDKRRWEAEMALEREKLNESIRQFNVKNGTSSGGGGGGGGGGDKSYQLPTVKDEPAFSGNAKTDAFISSFTSRSEANRHGMSASAYEKAFANKVNAAGLTAEEIAYLEEHFGF